MRYLFILAVAGLGMVSMSEANGQNFKAATPPPKVAKRAAVEFEGCTVNIAEVRAKYPTLSGFLQETAFQGGNLVFPNAKEAIAHYARAKGLDPKVLRKQLKAESQDVKKNYLKSKACKTATWWARSLSWTAPSRYRGGTLGLRPAARAEPRVSAGFARAHSV